MYVCMGHHRLTLMSYELCRDMRSTLAPLTGEVVRTGAATPHLLSIRFYGTVAVYRSFRHFLRRHQLVFLGPHRVAVPGGKWQGPGT